MQKFSLVSARIASFAVRRDAISDSMDRRRHPDLLALSDWLTDRAGPQVADEYTDKIESYIERLRVYPYRGNPRDDVEPGLRTIPYRRRTTIVYRVIDDRVEVVRVSHAGKQWDSD